LPRKAASPVSVGDTVFVVNDKTFEVRETVVTSNPSDHIWVRDTESDKRKKPPEPYFVGPHRWAKTREEAQQIADRFRNESRKGANRT
jgi:hypothetical protein